MRCCRAADVDAPLTMRAHRGRMTTIEFRGQGASPGCSVGPAVVVRDVGALAGVMPGAIVLCEHPSRELSTLLPILAGVASEYGGVLSSFATHCRELRVPYVAAVRGVTSGFEDGAPVSLDGSAGSVSVRSRPAQSSVVIGRHCSRYDSP